MTTTPMIGPARVPSPPLIEYMIGQNEISIPKISGVIYPR